MPYITQADRDLVERRLDIFGTNWAPDNAGQLNYLVSTYINNYFAANTLNYANVNEMIGALECMKLELYRLVAGPYENIKADANGPVYTTKVNEPKPRYEPKPIYNDQPYRPNLNRRFDA